MLGEEEERFFSPNGEWRGEDRSPRSTFCNLLDFRNARLNHYRHVGEGVSEYGWARIPCFGYVMVNEAIGPFSCSPSYLHNIFDSAIFSFSHSSYLRVFSDVLTVE